jgi:hypothetical protein
MTTREFAAVCRLVVVALALGLLHGCGGGAAGGAPDGGISGSGNSVGSISSFGSIVLNGRRFDTSAATIVVDGVTSSQSDLRVGQVVVVDANFDDLRASRVEYRAQIKGPVQSIDVIDASLGKASLTVLGQIVATNSATNFEATRLEPTASNALAVGDLVEVSGARDGNGVLTASYLENKPTMTEFQVIGVVANVTATTFDLGALTVDYSATGATPRSGDTVEARGAPADFDGATNTFEVERVEVLADLSPAAGDFIEIEGYITRFASSTDFDVNGLRVTTMATTRYENGSASSLGANVRVEVEGRANSSGTLVADKVEIESTGSVRIEGEVEATAIAPQRLTVLGVTYVVRPETDLEDDSDADLDPLAFGDIGIGDRVEMHGFLEGSSVIASEVCREDAEADALLRGRVTAKNAGAGELTVLGVTVTAGPDTQYEGAGSRAEFFAAVQVGDFVSAQWESFASTATPVDELSLEDD